MAASTPDAVTHGLTLKGAELSWSVLEGRKVVENRSRQLPRGWVALHTGLGKIQDAHLRTVKSTCADLPSEGSLPRGAIVGAIRIDRACDVAHCAGTMAEPWALGPVCNVIGAIVKLDHPVPHKGALGYWKIDANVRNAVQAALAAGDVVTNGKDKLPPPQVSSPRTTSAKRRRDA